MPGPLSRGKAWLERQLKKGVSEVNSESLSTNETHTKTVGATDYHYAGDYDGSDADARLDNAISASSAGDRIFLENNTYSDDRTISTRGTTFTGVDSSNNGSFISATWTLSGGEITLKNVRDATVSITGTKGVTVSHSQALTITVTDQGGTENALIYGCFATDVTFEVNTTASVMDACVASSATDNGTNTVGDIA